MTSKLGVYWSVSHRRPQDYSYFSKLNPSVMKVMDPGDNDIAWINANLPNSLVIARIHALSEQHEDMLKDPVGTGIRHAREWDGHATRLGIDRSRTLVLGQNEPRIWEPGVPEALRQYTIAMCEEATVLGLRVGAMQLSVGWPNNDGPDTPPNWSRWHGVDVAIRANRGALIAHEYWADNGPGENWGWWAGRALKCPWQVPIVIGECGVDIYVKDGSVPHASRGWRGRMEPERYARELADYVGRMSADSRYVGCAVFASDFASHEWFSFDIEPAYQAILSTPIPVYPTKPIETHLPVIISPTPTTPTATVIAPAGANIRTGPGTNYSICGAEPAGAALPIIGRNPARDWWLVSMQHVEGWVSASVVRAQGSGRVPIVAPEPVEPAPVPVGAAPPSVPQGDKWQRSRAFIARWEGGYQNVANDAGNWTGCKPGVGENKGTNFGISACSYPNLDIRNLTIQQADVIYFNDYWQNSGADKLDYPLCLLVLDTAVLHGVGTAQAWLREAGPDPYAFAAKRIRVYTKMGNWDFWGKAWVNRVADLLEEMGK